MILDRPTNLVLGAFTAVFNLVVLSLGALPEPIVIPAVIVGAANVAFGSVILLIANQPPTVNAGDQVNVQTPAGEPDRTVTM